MIKKTVTIINKLGLHARPCTLLVKTANKYKSEFIIDKDGQQLNGKSILNLMTLAAEQGTKLALLAEGEDETEMLTELEKLFASKFDEE